MAVIDELFAVLGFKTEGQEELQKFKRGLDDAEKKANSFASNVTMAAKGVVAGMAAIGAAAVGLTAGMFAMANAATRPLDDLVKAADRARVSVEDLQEWGFAAEQSGSSVQEMTNAVEMMSTRLAEAARGQGRAKTALEAYGLSATDAEGNIKNAADFMGELADRFQELGESERLDLGRQLGLSRGLITLLSQGNDEIERLRQTARDAGLVFTDADSRNAAAYNDSMNLLMRTVRAMRDRIAIDLLPTLMEMIGGMQGWLNANREVIQQNLGGFLQRIARHAATLSKVWQNLPEPGWKFYAVAAALLAVFRRKWFVIGAVAAAFDDFLTYMDGGESIIGSFINWIKELTGVSEGAAQAIAGITAAVGAIGSLALLAKIKAVGLVGGAAWVAGLLAGIGKSLMAAAFASGLVAKLAAGFAFLATPAGWAVILAGLAAAFVAYFWDDLKRLWNETDWAQLGRDIGTAILDGLRSMGGMIAGWFDDTLIAPARRAAQAIRDFFGISGGEGASQMPSISGPEEMGIGVGPQSRLPTPPMSALSDQDFASRFGAGMVDNSDKSTNIDVGGITVNPSPGMSEEGLANRVRDRLLSIHGASPVTP